MHSIHRWSVLGFLFGYAGFIAGCATVDPRRDYARASMDANAALGQQIDISPEDSGRLEALVAERLNGGLTADEAVQIALLNNPRVRAAFLRIGGVRADVVQAGLFTNPTIGLAFKLPEGGGLTQFEFSLAQNIADLWMIPSRTKAAERDLDRAILVTASQVASLANDAKVAYYNAVAAQRALEIARENLELVKQLEQIAQARLEAGMVGALDVNLVRGLVLRTQVDERNARLSAATARRTLATLLGLDGPAEDLVFSEVLPEPRAAPVDPVRLVEVAREFRLDLRAARDAVRAAEARVQAEYARVFQSVEIGFDLERGARRALPGRNILADTARASIANGGPTAPEIESRGQRDMARRQEIEAILGPSLALTLPVFDQNQAQIAKAKYALEEADALLESLDRSIAQETREAVDRLVTAWSVAELYERDLLPQARSTLELSESAYRVGTVPILNVIDAQRSLLDVRQAYVGALQNAANSLVDLERATAQPIGVLLKEAGPATQPAASMPATKHEPSDSQSKEGIR